jgi:hypothetical protein
MVPARLRDASSCGYLTVISIATYKAFSSVSTIPRLVLLTAPVLMPDFASFVFIVDSKLSAFGNPAPATALI